MSVLEARSPDDINHPDAGRSAAKDRLLEIGIVILPVLLGGFAALRAFPVWDDGVLYLNAVESGAAAVNASQPDRPFMGHVWGMLANHNMLWTVAGIVYIVTWILTGIVTMWLWTIVYPEWRRYAPAAGLLAVAPIVLETQTVAINPVFSGHVGSVLCYASLIWVWARPRPLIVLPALVAILFSALLSEYALLAVMACSLTMYWLSRATSRPPEQVVAIRRALLACLATAIVGFLIYHSLGSAEARPEIRPETQLRALGIGHLLGVPVRVPFSLWTGTMGRFLTTLGEVNLSRATVWGLPAGAAMSLLLYLFHFRRVPVSATPARSVEWRRVVPVVVPLTLGIAAITAMSTSIRGNVASRYWQPLIPLVACSCLFIVLTVTRSRMHRMVVLVIAFLAGYMEGNVAARADQMARQMDAIGERLHHELAPSGLTVALFANVPTNHFVGDPVARPYELVAHLTRGWPAADRARFWAAAFSWQPIHESLPGFGGVCGTIPEVDSQTMRGWSRQGKVAKVLWLSFDADEVQFLERAPSSAPEADLPGDQTK